MSIRNDDRRRPNLFIVGAPHSGTTSLFAYLSAHPDVFPSREKEPFFFFGPDERFEPRLRSRLDDYLALFAGGEDARYRLEASTGYLSSDRAAERIAAFEPRARIVAMLRNPIELAFASYRHARYAGHESARSFAEALALEDRRSRGEELPKGAFAPFLLYRRNARLGEHLRRYLDVFAREQVHAVLFDDFAADTAASYAGVLGFLGLDAHEPDLSARNAGRSARSPRLVRAVRRNRGWARHLLPPRTRRRLWDALMAGLSRPADRRAALPEALRDELAHEFADDVRELGTLLGRDLETLWLSPRPASTAG